MSILCVSFFIVNVACATTLEDTLEMAVDYHPVIKSTMASKNAAMYAIEGEEAGLYPQVSFTVSSGREGGNSSTIRTQSSGGNSIWSNRADVSFQQLIYDGGNTDYLVEAANNRFYSASHVLAEKEQGVILEAAIAHLNVLRREALYKLAEGNYQSHLDYVDSIQEKADFGAATSTDASQAAARLSLAHSTYIDSEQQLFVAKDSYHELVGDYPDGLEDINELDTQKHLEHLKSIEQAIEQGMSNNPTIAEAFSDVKVAESEYKQASLVFSPDVYFGVTGSVKDNSFASDIGSENSQSHDYFIGFTLNWDLYRGGFDIARKKETAQRKISSEELSMLTQRDFRESIKSIWQQREKLAQRLPLLKNYSASTDDVLEGYIEQFTVNRRSLLDVLDRQIESYRAKSDLINSTYESLILDYRLLHSVGGIKEIL